MKYKQVCPECFFEIVISDVNEKVRNCPNCNRGDIAYQKLIRIEEENSINESVATDEVVATEPFVTPWLEFEDDNVETDKDGECISFKYVSGIIKSDFEITVLSKHDEILFGRSAVGQEYFQYDNRISNEHFYVKYNCGNWLIRDNNSTNGILLNGNLLEPSIEYELNPGDVIALGKTLNSTKLEVHLC